jgi:RNA polymerase sigma-70 factor (ECF subfamily)
MRVIPTSANGQPAFGVYMRQPDGGYLPFQLPVLTLGSDGLIEHATVFFDLSLFEKFGLPASLPPADMPPANVPPASVPATN